MKTLFIIFFSLGSFIASSQDHYRIKEILPDVMKENVTVHSMCSDEYESSYLIWVKDSVKPHYHAEHTELVYVLEGEGDFYLNDEVYHISQGDYLRIPKGNIHSFKTTSKETVQVLSIQTPEFKGKDRIWVENQKK